MRSGTRGLTTTTELVLSIREEVGEKKTWLRIEVRILTVQPLVGRGGRRPPRLVSRDQKDAGEEKKSEKYTHVREGRHSKN